MKLPHGWKKQTLGHHIDLLTGYPFESSRYTDLEDGVRLLRGDNVMQGWVRWDDAKKWPQSNLDTLDRYRLAAADIVIAMDRTWVKSGLKVAMVSDKDIPSLLVQRVARLRATGDLTQNFLYALVRSYAFEQYVKGVKTETAVPHISATQIEDFVVHLPPRKEQEKIAAYLLHWDSTIENTTSLIEAKQQIKQSLMSQLLLIEKRLKGYREPWRHYHLGDLFVERCDVGYENLPLLSITGDAGIILRDGGSRKDSSSEDKSSYLRICPGDIGYNTMRMWQGVSALSSLEGIVSPAYTVCTPKNGIDGQFMAYLFKLPRVINLFYRYSQGLTSDTWNLKFHNFAKIKVTIPDIEEQKAIVKVLKVCDEEIRLLKIHLEAIKKQKRGLMQKLLTGAWRVKTAGEVS